MAGPAFAFSLGLWHEPNSGRFETPVELNDRRHHRSGCRQCQKTDGFTNILANPRIRIRARETAKVMIGERLPNITTTLTSTGFSSENIQYIDVGLKLEAQPFIYPDNEIVIKLALEVSSVAPKPRPNRARRPTRSVRARHRLFCV